jgi:signal transduction histidine kinase
MDDMIEMIQDILVLAKTKSGEPMGEIGVLDVATELKACGEKYREQAEQKELDLRIQCTAESLPVRIDHQGCRLILSNLISNAVKYTQAGSVRIAAHTCGTWVTVEIQDTGMGIPEKDIPKLFREFFRASNAKKSNINGTGVGLAGVKSIVERFDGQLELQSVENQGSTFTIRLPLHKVG